MKVTFIYLLMELKIYQFKIKDSELNAYPLYLSKNIMYDL